MSTEGLPAVAVVRSYFSSTHTSGYGERERCLAVCEFDLHCFSRLPQTAALTGRNAACSSAGEWPARAVLIDVILP